MKISAEEQHAIATVVQLGRRFGFGTLITHLQTAWAKTLIEQYDMDEKAARVERGEWDETGQRYAPNRRQRQPRGEEGS